MASTTSSKLDSKALVPASACRQSEISREEVDLVTYSVKEERGRACITIGVVEEHNLRRLAKACQYRGVMGRLAPPMLFTTADQLQDTIDGIKLSDRHRTLKILSSPRIADLYLHVPSHFQELVILRCASRHDKGKLFIDGSSTYNRVRLDKWQAHRRKHHTLVIGHEGGVRIRVAGISQLAHWGRARSDFTDLEQSELQSHLKTLSKENCWDKVKGAVASILATAVGSTTLSIDTEAATEGITVTYQFGIHAFELGIAGTKLSTIATSAGPAVALTVAAVSAVYFIPWESLFDWVRNALRGMWDAVCAVWQRFKTLVVQLFANWTEKKKNGVGDNQPRPLAITA